MERLDAKQAVFSAVEQVVGSHTVLATNTSSLAVTAIARVLQRPERCVGLHFFNPAPLMALVEVIPALQTEAGLAEACADLMRFWGKSPALAKEAGGGARGGM